MNRCIYCGDITNLDALTREHIFPYALNGAMILPKASCKVCQKKINEEFESTCLSEMFKFARTHLGMQSRSGLNDYLPVAKFPDETQSIEIPEKDIPIEQHPLALFLPRFEPPGLLYNRSNIENLTILAISTYMDPSFADRADAAGPNSGILQRMPFFEFARLLAKIAHGYLSAEDPAQKIKPYLPDLILGKSRFGRLCWRSSRPDKCARLG